MLMDAPNHYIDLDATRADMTTISENMEFIACNANEFLPASSKNLTKLLQKIDRFTVRLYIYTCTARSLILGLEMLICLLLQSSIWSKKCTRLQNRLAHIIYNG